VYTRITEQRRERNTKGISTLERVSGQYAAEGQVGIYDSKAIATENPFFCVNDTSEFASAAHDYDPGHPAPSERSEVERGIEHDIAVLWGTVDQRSQTMNVRL
jgi:hypothetical protein